MFLYFSATALILVSTEFGEDSVPIDIKLLVKHVISKELQVRAVDFVHLIF